MMPYQQSGFTLVELMLSLVLGLLLSAAAIQLLYLSSVSSTMQQAGSSLVDTKVFGVDLLLRQIKKAGLGSQNGIATNAFYQNHLTPQGGVVLTAPSSASINPKTGGFDLKSDTNLRGLLNGANAIDIKLLTSSENASSSSNIKNIANSDQLTIQYRMPEDNQIDCSGRNVRKDDYVIERYFLRNDTNYGLALVCVAAIYNLDTRKLDKDPIEPIDISHYIKPNNTEATSNLAGSGEIIIPNVDYFRVLLGVSDSKSFATEPSQMNLNYIPIPKPSEIQTVLKNKRIVTIQIGLLLRSSKATKTISTTYKVLDKDNLVLKDSLAYDGKIREVVETTVLLRNARGITQ